MQEVIIVLQVLIFLGLGCIIFFRKYFLSYLEKKAENLATKEDISEITDKIESVKHDYAGQLESTKAELSNQINTYSYRYEKEYDVLTELTALLVDVKDACIRLRPLLDTQDTSKPEHEIKMERLEALFEARKSLYSIREKKRPFYPQEIYEAVLDIDRLVHKESFNYKYKSPLNDDKFQDYWDEAEKNQTAIVDKAERAMKVIRERVINWDSLSNGL